MWSIHVLFVRVLCVSVLYVRVLCVSVLYVSVLCVGVLYVSVLCFSVLYVSVLCVSVLYVRVLCVSVLYVRVLCVGRYFYIALLREPVQRYLSEWKHVRRGATWSTSRHWCGGRDATEVSAEAGRHRGQC